jgi:zinc transporter 7
MGWANTDAGNATTSWMLPFTAGGFIYVALVDVLPTLVHTHTSLRQSLAEIVAMMLGVQLMVAVGWLEHMGGDLTSLCA